MTVSMRERQVGELVAAGRTTRAIARELGLSPATVATYVRRLYAKLGVQSRGALVAALAMRGLLPLHPVPGAAGTAVAPGPALRKD